MSATSPTFGQWLKQRRRASGLTRAALADLVPCSPDTINKIERGLRKPSMQMARRLAECLKVPARDHGAWVAFARSDSPKIRETIWHDSICPPTNLPIPLNPLIGRDQEIQAVFKRLADEDVRLLTLVGPPGVGKTRLGLEVAIEAWKVFEGGVFFVSLASATDPAFVLPILANALGLEDSGTRPILDRISRSLSKSYTLLLLDNFEHVAGAAPFVARLLARCPLLKVLVTSRVPLQVRGERQFHVQPLKLPDPDRTIGAGASEESPALALFLDCARAVQPSFSLTEDNGAAVAAICRHTGGLPLALELSAVHLRALTPLQVLEHLQRGKLPACGALHDLDERQQTLRGALNWSYNLLTPLEQALFARLAIFAGEWTLEDATAVCMIENEAQNLNGDGDLTTLNHLASLVNQSLVLRREEKSLPRFSMLPVIRTYAQEKLLEREAGEEIQRRYAEHYLALAETAEPHLRGPDDTEWLDRLDREQAHFRSALAWGLSDHGDLILSLRLAGSLWWFWRVSGHTTEGRIWLERVLARANRLTTSGGAAVSALAKAHIGLARIAWYQGDYGTSRDLAETGVSLASETGDEWQHCYALQILADTLADLGISGQAGEIAIQCIELSQSIGDPWLRALPLTLLGELVRLQGDWERALAYYSESLALMLAAGDRRSIAYAFYNIGQVEQSLGDLDVARAYYVHGLRLTSSLGVQRGVAVGLEKIAAVAGAQGEYAKAARLLGAAARIREAALSPVEFTEREVYERAVVAARVGLGEDTFAERWTEGLSLPLDWMIADAMEG